MSTSRFLASEFSAKVKAFNLIEENILKQRLKVYTQQEKKNIRMIEKDAKKFQEELDEKFLNSTRNNNHTIGTTEDELYLDGLIGGGESELHHGVSRKTHKSDRIKKKKRKKTARHIDSEYQQWTNVDSQQITRETHMFRPPLNNYEHIDSKDTPLVPHTTSKERRYRSPFLPKLKLSHSKGTNNNSHTQVTKTVDYLSLPPIKNSSLTSSLSLPSIHLKDTTTKEKDDGKRSYRHI